MIQSPLTVLTCSWENRDEDLVSFHWESGHTFLEMLESIGNTPLPPYMNRDPEKEDKVRYQTVYSKVDGAVAAPTAGLHFSKNQLEILGNSRKMIEVTLHVSAGTFRPIKTDDILQHDMHVEIIELERPSVEGLLGGDKIISVGTTSLRTLESLYWYGVKILHGEYDFKISKLYPYQWEEDLPSKDMALKAVLDRMDSMNLNVLTGSTEIFIFPGYEFRMVEGLITNFHMPGSTLLLLIAAFVGDDWRSIYQGALDNDYRFLSYGDSSLLLRS